MTEASFGVRVGLDTSAAAAAAAVLVLPAADKGTCFINKNYFPSNLCRK